jgi:RimJ/RimL family protein N-acetyltransferase
MIRLETERLWLRPFRQADLDAYAEICADPEVMRYLGHGKTQTRAEAWRAIAFFLGHWYLRGYGLWAVEDKATGSLLGRIGLYNPEGWPGIEVGWMLARSCWGRGLATEGGRAAMRYAFEELKVPHLLSVIHPDNRASIRVAEKLGLRFERTMQILEFDVVIYGRDP